MKVISRKRAKAKSQSWYFTGKMCLHGHISKRWVSNSRCHECVAVCRKTPQGRKVLLEAYARFNASPLGYERNIRARNSPRGKDSAYIRRTRNPLTIECRRRVERNRYERRKVWRAEYLSRPDVAERTRQRKRDRYRDDAEHREKIKDRVRERYHRPEVRNEVLGQQRARREDKRAGRAQCPDERC